MKTTWVSLGEERDLRFFLENKIKSFGDKNLIKIYYSYLHQAQEERKKEEVDELSRKVEKEAEKKVEEYIEIITEAVDNIHEYITTHFKETDFKIIEERADFNLNTFEIKILFIIDTSIENEMKFLSLLLDTQQKLLNQKKYFAEFLYINKRNCKTIDKDSINLDFPFVRVRK